MSCGFYRRRNVYNCLVYVVVMFKMIYNSGWVMFIQRCEDLKSGNGVRYWFNFFNCSLKKIEICFI